MSEKDTHTGAPIEAQRSGFDGERRDSGADELSPQAEASEQSSSRRVSRETRRDKVRSDSEHPDGHSSSRSLVPPPPTKPKDGFAGTPDQAQAMLNEIMDRDMDRSRNTPEEKPESETPPQENPPAQEQVDAPPPPVEKNKPSSAYIYLAVLFGSAFLMLLLAYFVQQRNNDAVQDDLRVITASREELLEDIKELEAERDRLEKEAADQKDLASQRGEALNLLTESVEQTSSTLSDRNIQTNCLEYFWYLDRFMDGRDYPMAAAVILLSADYYRDTWYNGQISINPAQLEQYEAYRQELMDRGYLQQLDQPRDDGVDIWFTGKWDPSQRDDMAALCILWCALDKHFVVRDDNGASQYLCLYPLGSPDSGYQEWVQRRAGRFALEQFQLLKDELVESKWLTIAEDGTMGEGFGPTGVKNDLLYNLPFELPINPALIPLH